MSLWHETPAFAGVTWKMAALCRVVWKSLHAPPKPLFVMGGDVGRWVVHYTGGYEPFPDAFIRLKHHTFPLRPEKAGSA